MTMILWLIAAFAWGICAGIAIKTKWIKDRSKGIHDLNDEEFLKLVISVKAELEIRLKEMGKDNPFEEFEGGRNK